MVRYIITRFCVLSVSLLVASGIIFTMLEVVPGDPASFMLGINAEADTLAAMRRELGLDQPMLQRYLSWLGG
ncbi:MAG: ABC transporter permease, partial [Alphaproteobacteria bacterium]|nr:ABC transporter permease [Alphaproteobacteria bacterium]